MNTKFLLVLVVTAAVTTVAQAQVILDYTFTSGSNAPTLYSDDVSASNTSWSGVTGATYSAGSGTAFGNSSGTPSSFQTTSYLSFTVTPDVGFVLVLDELKFDLGAHKDPAQGTSFVTNARVRTSVGGFATDLTINPGSNTTATTTGDVNSTTVWNTFTVDLSGIGYDGVSAITIRLYPFDNQGSTNSFLRFDNISLSAVPEPSAASVLMAGLLGFFGLTRNVRKRK